MPPHFNRRTEPNGATQGPPPSRHAARENSLFQPGELLRIARRRWKPGLALGILAGVALACVLLVQDPRYEATSSLIVQLDTDHIVNVQQVVETAVQGNEMLAAAMNTHVERLKSRAMAESVAASLSRGEQLRLVASSLKSDALTPREDQILEASIHLIEEGVEVDWLPQTLVLQIHIQATDAYLAQLLANRYATLYKQAQDNLRQESNREAVSFLSAQTQELKAQIESGESELHAYRREHRLLSIDENQRIIADRLSQLNHALTDTRVRLLTVDSYIESVRRAGDDPTALVSIAQLGNRPNVLSTFNQVQALRQARAILAGEYLPQHPIMLENETAQRASEAALWDTLQIARDELHIQRAGIQEEVDRLNTEITATETESLRLDQLAVDYGILSQRLEAERRTFDLLVRRASETSLSQNLNLTTIQILDQAKEATKPTWPDTKKIALASVLLTGMILVALPLALEFFDQRLSTFAEIENFLNVPILGDIIFRRTKDERALATAVSNRDALLREPFEVIYSNFKVRQGASHLPLSLLITSSLPREGKSFVASNFAETLSAHHLKTVLIDCDWRRSSLHRIHHLDNRSGVASWLRSTEPLAENLLEDSHLGLKACAGSPGLYILPSGCDSTPNPAADLDEHRMSLLVQRLKQEFDAIIFDTPPVGLFPDATLLARHADHTLFVARQNKVSRQCARRAILAMNRTSAPVIGLIFNAVRNLKTASGSQSGEFGATYQSSVYNRYRRYYRNPPKSAAKAESSPVLAPLH